MGVIRRVSWTFQCRTCWLAFLNFSCTSWNKEIKQNFLTFLLNNTKYAAHWASPITLTSRCWWLLWREARRSWSSWEAEWRAEGVSWSVLPSEASWMRFCKDLCCSCRSWNCFFFSSSTCSNLEKRSRNWDQVNDKCLRSLIWFRVFYLGICPLHQ